MKKETARLFAVNALFALIPVLLIFIPLLIDGSGWEAYGVKYTLYMVLVEFGVIVLPALIAMFLPCGRSMVERFWHEKPSAAILMMIPLALCAYFCMNGVTVGWFVILQQFGVAQMPQTVPTPQSGSQLWLGFAVIALCPALCEEFFFRGVMQPALHRGMKPWAAIVLTGCLFGLVHGQIVALPAHVLLGMGLCLVAYWTRSVWYTVVWHLMQNGISVLIAYFSDSILAASGEMAQTDAAAMLEQEPVMMLMSAGMMIAFFGAGLIMLLAALFFATKRHRLHAVPQALPEDKPQFTAYAPMLFALVCIVYSYVVNTIPLMGGGA